MWLLMKVKQQYRQDVYVTTGGVAEDCSWDLRIDVPFEVDEVVIKLPIFSNTTAATDPFVLFTDLVGGGHRPVCNIRAVSATGSTLELEHPLFVGQGGQPKRYGGMYKFTLQTLGVNGFDVASLADVKLAFVLEFNRY